MSGRSTWALLLVSLWALTGCGTVYSVRLEGASEIIGGNAQITRLPGDSVEIAIPVRSSAVDDAPMGCLVSGAGGGADLVPTGPQRTPRGRSVLVLRTSEEGLPGLQGRIYVAAPAGHFAVNPRTCAESRLDPGAFGHVIALQTAQQGPALAVGLGAAVLLVALGAGIPW